jgi:phenylacetate-CoA ligase
MRSLGATWSLLCRLRAPVRRVRWLQERRLQRLRRVVAHARGTVPFYARKFAEVAPEDIACLQDLQRIPITTSAELRAQALQDLTSTAFAAGSLKRYYTSGTSGKPLELMLSNRDTQERQLYLARFLLAHGWRPWWRRVEISRDTEAPSESVVQRLAARTKTLVPIALPFAEQADRLARARPRLIDGLPHSLELLARWMIENNRCYARAALVSYAGGAAEDHARELFRTALGHRGIEYYGATECGIIGFECPFCGLNVFSDDSHIVDVLDDAGHPVAPGGTGRVVVTSLDQFATPIIRYDIGDRVSLPPASVRCRSRFAHYLRIEGRVTDCIALPNGRVIHHQHLYPFVRVEAEHIRQYQFVAAASGELRFRCVPKAGAGGPSAGQRVCEALSAEFGVTVRLELCEAIPLDASGKMKPMKNENP